MCTHPDAATCCYNAGPLQDSKFLVRRHWTSALGEITRSPATDTFLELGESATLNALCRTFAHLEGRLANEWRSCRVAGIAN
jgi:hypothetical protein